MSRVVDERIVSMQFDNKRFEQNVSTTMGTLDKLKKSLNLSGASRGLEDLSTTAKKINFNPLGSAVDSVKVKFSALQVVGVTALSNLANQAVNTAKRVAAAFTIDPIRTGFQEYETQIGAVQTILANTQSKGTTLDDVNRALDTLNKYADMTIYNFTEMTRNIGTFTAAGVDLETSVTAIQGIANLAAVSGSTSQQASTAMYQLSQALASGTVKLMDWNSVVNAGMGGQVFQDALKETARAHGVAIDKMIEKNGSFRETLKDEWLTSEILTETLAKFTMTTEGLTEAQIEQNRAMLKGQGYTDAQIEKIFELGKTATDAATKVKTFTQLKDTLKEAAQSGWTQTWELIVGDFEQSKTLWTGVSEVLGGLIEDMSESRNTFLKGALSSNWDKLIEKIEAAGVETETFEKKVKDVAKAQGLDVDKIVEDCGSLEEAFRSGALSSNILKEAMDGLGKAGTKLEKNFDLGNVKRTLKAGMKGEDTKEVEKALEALGYSLTGEDGKYYGGDGLYGLVAERAVRQFQKDKGLKEDGVLGPETLAALKAATEAIADANGETILWDKSIHDLINGIEELGGREKLIESFKNIWKGAEKIFGSIKTAWDNTFDKITPEQVGGWIDSFHKFTEKLTISDKTSEKLTKTFEGLFGAVKIVGGVVGKVISVGFKVACKVVALLGEGILNLTSLIGPAIEKVQGWIKAFFELPQVQEYLKKFKMEFGNLGEVIKSRSGGIVKRIEEFINRVKSMDGISLDNIKTAFSDFFNNVLGPLWKNEDGTTIFDGIIESVKNLWTNAGKFLEETGIKFGEIGEKISNFFAKIRENIRNNMGGLIALGSLLSVFLIFAKIKDAIELIAEPLGQFGELAEEFGKGIKRLSKAISFNLKAEGVKAIATSIAILAGSLIALTLVDTTKLIYAVGALTTVIIGLGVLVATMNTFGKDLKNIGKLAGSIFVLSGALFVFAIAAKTLAGVDEGALGKSAVVLVGFLGFALALSKITKGSSVYLASFGIMMLKLSGALLIMSVAAGILGNMKLETLAKGVGAVGVFLAMMAGMMWATKLLQKDTPRFAATMAGLSASLLIMSVAVGILGKMDPTALSQGGTAVFLFLSMMAAMMYATNVLSKDLPKFGASMLGLSAGLVAMAAAVAILGNMKPETLIKGGIAIGLLLGAMVGMMKATTMLTKHSANASKVGLMMLSFATSMILLTGAIAVLSMIELGDLAKAVVAVGMVGGIFAGMVALTKFAKVGKGVKTTIITMAAAVGVLAISVAALSFIDPTKLLSASGALAAVMGMFALLSATAKAMNLKTIGSILVLVGVVGVLAYALKELSDTSSDGALKAAGALSALVLSLSASCLILAGVGAMGPAALIGVGVLAALLLVIGGFAAIAIASLPAIGTQLSTFMNNMSGFIEGASKITPQMANGIKTLAEAILILTGASILNGISSFFSLGNASLSSFGAQMASFALDLASFITTIASATGSMSGTGEVGSINWDNIDKSVDVAVRLSEVANKIPDTSGWSTLFAKKNLAKFGTQIASFALDLSTYLTTIGGKFTVLNSKGEAKALTINWDQITKATDVAVELADVANKIPDTSGWGTLFAKKDLAKFGTQIASFALDLSTYLTAVGGKFTVLDGSGSKVSSTTVNWANVDKATDAAVELAGIAETIPDTSGWGTIFSNKNLAEFGNQIALFAADLATYITSVGGKFTVLNGLDEVEAVNVNWTSVTKATEVAKELAGVATSIPDTSGWSTTFSNKNLAEFGNQIALFASDIATYITAVGGKFTVLNGLGEVEEVKINWTSVTKAAEVAKELANVATEIPDTSGWSTAFSNKNLAEFGNQISLFASDIATYIAAVGGKFTVLNSLGEVEDVNVNWDNITNAANVAKELANVATEIPDTSGWSTVFSKKDLGTFGSQVATFATGISEFITSINGAFSNLESGVTINFDIINSVVSVANQLAGMAKTVGENSAGWEWLTGKDGLDAFGTKVETLGAKLANFCSKVSGEDFDVSAITNAIAEVEKIVGLAERLGGENVGDIGSLGEQISGLSCDLQTFAINTADLDATKFSAIATGLSDLASINITNADAIQSFVDSLGKVGTDGVDAFASSFKNTTPKVIASISAMMGLTQIAIRMKGVGIVDSMSTIASNAAKAAGNSIVLLRFFAAGLAMAQGLANGISAGQFTVVATAVAMAQAALSAAKEALGINSPSKEFMWVGQSVPEGFAKGVAKYGYMVTSSVTSMAGKALDKTRDAIARIASVIDSDIDSQPTIRPVLDLSAVTAGAGTINDMLNLNPSVGVMSNINAISSMMNANQNGANDDVISAIKDLGSKLGNSSGDSYNINGITYDDGSNIAEAVKTLVRAARVERRV